MKLPLNTILLFTLTVTAAFLFGCDDDTEDTAPNEIKVMPPT
jgi:hypothetical protein